MVKKIDTLYTCLCIVEYVTQIRTKSIEAVDEYEMSNPTPTTNITNGEYIIMLIAFFAIMMCIHHHSFVMCRLLVFKSKLTGLISR